VHWCSFVCVSVCVFVAQNRDPYKNGWTNRGAVWSTDSGKRTKEPLLGESLNPPWVRAIWGDISKPIVKYREYPACGPYSQPYSAYCINKTGFNYWEKFHLVELNILIQNSSKPTKNWLQFLFVSPPGQRFAQPKVGLCSAFVSYLFYIYFNDFCRTNYLII